MYTPFLSRVTSMASRAPSWVGRQGPLAVAWCGQGLEASVLPYMVKYPCTDFNSTMHISDNVVGGVTPYSNMEEFPILNLGDMGQGGGEEWRDAVRETYNHVAEKGYVPLLVGGTADAAIPALRGLTEVHKDPIVFVHIDSKADCATHGGAGLEDTIVRDAHEMKLIKGTIQFGTREVPLEERAERTRLGVKFWDANAMFSMNLALTRNVRNGFPLFISVDASVFDPAHFTGASHRVPAGITLRDFMHLMVCMRAPRVVGVHITGLSDTRSDVDNLFLAKLVKEVSQKVYAISAMTEEEVSSEMQRLRQAGVVGTGPMGSGTSGRR
eukprot:PhM_4_TR16466/c0_g1_i1/m.83075